MSQTCHEETCPQITSMGSRGILSNFRIELSMRCDKVPEGAARCCSVDTFSISPNPIIDPLAWYGERIDATSGWKFVRKHCWLTNLRRHG
jgi:hypothetical protein